MSKEKSEVKEAPDGTLEQGEFKLKKKKPKKLTNNKVTTTKVDLSKKPESKKEDVTKDKVTKVDLSKKEDNAIQEKKSDDSNVTIKESKNEESSKAVVEEVRPADKVENTEEKKEEKKEEVITPISEITEEVKEEPVLEKTPDPEVPKVNLPENVEKLVNFMEETGGTVEDYVRLNVDYSKVDNSTLLNEYYKNTKPHLNQEEINFIMEDNFSYDEEVDEERDVKKKKLAYKEEIAKAKNFLEETKKKYYDEIKLRPGVTQEQQKAMDFFNRYNEGQQKSKKQHSDFVNKTKDYFSKDFKGFEFNLGEKKFRYNINNAEDVAREQSELQNFTKRFLNKDGSIADHKGYHKALYSAKNADTIANHFYEQGKADATKDIIAKSKNISNEARSSAPGDLFVGGFKVRAISGVDSSKLKIKTRKK
jgi:hypothetical protein